LFYCFIVFSFHSILAGGFAMRAIQMAAFGDESVLKLVEIPTPEPGPGEVRVQLHSAGINPAESYIRTGTYVFLKPDLPYVPGFDGAGIVDSVGSGVSHVKEGDRVFVASLLAERRTGTYAEAVVCDGDAVHLLPDRFTYAQGSAIGIPGHAAYRALFQRAMVEAGEVVLVHGATGGVGSMTVQLARAHGAYVIGTGDKEEDFGFLKDIGVHEAYCHYDPNYFEKIRASVGGADVIIEMLANVNLERDAGLLNMFGRIVIVGNRGSIDFTPRLLMIKESDVLGMALWNSPPHEYRAAVLGLAAALESGVIRPVTGPEYPLEQAAAAQADVIVEGNTRGKMTLKIR
jgi:NADPH2:quinone reductase